MIDHAIVDNMIIIDIGSNDGFESSYILKKYPKISAIHLVEPDINNIHNIKQKISKADNKVIIHNLAIADRDYSGDFYVSRQGGFLSSISDVEY